MHRPTLQQGNRITQEMVDQLRPGMTKKQVEFVLGKPVQLNTFNVNHWDYVYTFEDRWGNKEKKVLSIVFENDELVSLGGDFQPTNFLDAGGEPQVNN